MAEIKCRKCGKPVKYRVPKDAPYFPFCSERCRLVDLDKWFCEEHRISSPLHRREDESAPDDPSK